MPSKRRREKESISSSLYLSRLLVIAKGRKPLQVSLGKCGTENLVWPDRLKQELISDRGSRVSAASIRISVLLFQFASPRGGRLIPDFFRWQLQIVHYKDNQIKGRLLSPCLDKIPRNSSDWPCWVTCPSLEPITAVSEWVAMIIVAQSYSKTLPMHQ